VERNRRIKAIYDRDLHLARMKWPWDRIKQAESSADFYKQRCQHFEEKVDCALKDVVGQRVVNQQLMMLTDELNNYKREATTKIFDLQRVVEEQRKKEKELLVKTGNSSYMGAILSTLTTGDMGLYNQVADHFPDRCSPKSCGMKTPRRTHYQLETHNERLQSITAVAPAGRLLWLDKQIGRQVKQRCIQYRDSEPGTKMFKPSPSRVPALQHSLNNQSGQEDVIAQRLLAKHAQQALPAGA
jgi:hypothetical protein